MCIDKRGIEFSHRGDGVMWLWPWRREKWNRRYISFGFDGVFSSLREMDKLWEDYFAAEKELCPPPCCVCGENAEHWFGDTGWCQIHHEDWKAFLRWRGKEFNGWFDALNAWLRIAKEEGDK